ncbi:MAG: hypothetical protein U9Q06_02085 [Nanoarchaeota archaeon]|nr:hypothetical protein [Nanoarchaeota archaeon]
MHAKEHILPSYLVGVVEEEFLDCYVFNNQAENNLNSGFAQGLERGKGLTKLVGNDTPELDTLIRGAKNYQDRRAGIRRNLGISIKSEAFNFENHLFLYGIFHGLEISTRAIMNRDTDGDIVRAFLAVLEKHGEKIST